ncbi:MAG: dTDP-4-dehydrorhamnose 3,5-epimerase [Bacteroidota bacterium]
MKKIPTKIPEVFILEPDVFRDSRGYFFESYNKDKFTGIGIDFEFIQDNQSCSQKDVLRGLHFQNPPYAQGKLVRVIRGAVFDVAVDIRKNSPTFGAWVGAELTADNNHMLWLPPGFAHGFLTLENNTVFSYKCTSAYNKAAEGIIMWNDPDIGIHWGITNPVLSDRDLNASSLKKYLELA